MNSRIRDYINDLFQNAPMTKKAVDLKEEMIVNAEEKYKDLLAGGYREEDAISAVVNSIGNLEELFRELEREENEYIYMEMEMQIRQKKALYTAIAIGIYIFALVVFMFFCVMGDMFSSMWYMDSLPLVGFIIALLLCIAPTCMLVYVSQLLPKESRRKERRTEGYQEWNERGARSKELRKAISSVIWLLTLIIYFLFSFGTGAWHITWIIFLIAACVESIVHIIFPKNK